MKCFLFAGHGSTRGLSTNGSPSTFSCNSTYFLPTYCRAIWLVPLAVRPILLIGILLLTQRPRDHGRSLGGPHNSLPRLPDTFIEWTSAFRLRPSPVCPRGSRPPAAAANAHPRRREAGVSRCRRRRDAAQSPPIQRTRTRADRTCWPSREKRKIIPAPSYMLEGCPKPEASQQVAPSNVGHRQA